MFTTLYKYITEVYKAVKAAKYTVYVLNAVKDLFF